MDNFEYGERPDGPPVLGYIMAGSVLTTVTIVGSLLYTLFM